LFVARRKSAKHFNGLVATTDDSRTIIGTRADLAHYFAVKDIAEGISCSCTDDVDEFVATIGFDERRVSRILSLGFLAPDLTEAILEGRHHPNLGECLGDIALDWGSQRNRSWLG
jgi:hypothetical protein